jgi:hypothetical protein
LQHRPAFANTEFTRRTQCLRYVRGTRPRTYVDTYVCLVRQGFLDAWGIASHARGMVANVRVLAAMVYGLLVAGTAILSRSHTGIVAVVGAIVLAGFYVLISQRRDSPR